MRTFEHRGASEINDQKNMSKVIGVTGHPASGKDTVADYLVSRGFTKISGGDILREEMIELGIPTDRSHIQEYVKEMRKKYGNGYPSEETINRIKGDTVISGVRNSEEVRIFREKLGKDFKLVAVEAPLEVRYSWAKERGRIGDDVSFERFKTEEEVDRSSDSGSHEVDLIINQSDFKIINNAGKKELFNEVDKIISK